MNLWTWFDETSQKRMIHALLLAMLAGLSIAAFVLTLINSVHDIVLRERYEWYLATLPLLIGVFLYAKRIAQQQMAQVAEQFAKRHTLTITNYFRQSEFAQVEHYDRAEIYAGLSDIRTVSRLAVKLVNIGWCLTAVVICWLYLMSLAFLAGLIFLVGLFCMYLMFEVHEKLYVQASHEQAEQEAEMFQYMRHLFWGYKTLLINRRKNHDLVENFIFPAINRSEAFSQKTGWYYSGRLIFEDTIYFLMLGVFVFVLSAWYPTHQIFAILTVALYAWSLVNLLFRDVPEIDEAVAAIERLEALTEALKPDKPVREVLYDAAQTQLQSVQTISLHDVCFTYQSSEETPRFAVGPVTLDITAGKIIFVSGGNGSGKTTFLKILMGLYQPNSGVITINGTPVQMSDHRYLFSAVFNDFHLFDQLYGITPVDPQKVTALLFQMHLQKHTQWKHDRFTTLALSAGQRRRMALVAALSEDRPICVFDEWAADQSPDFRRYFYEEVLPSLKAQGKTVIAITHDAEYYHVADQVIKMEDGKIIPS